MRTRIAAAALGVAMIATPAAAESKKKNEGKPGYERAIEHALANGDHEPYQERYLRLYERFAHEFGVQDAGRNVVIFGELTKDGVREATRERVERSSAYFEASLNPPEPTVTARATAATTAYAGGAAASSATAPCESGGDYGAVNPAGYYGAYQFDQQTWDAYAPEGYAGTNPAAAPPAVQDQAAASVPYDAWPNC